MRSYAALTLVLSIGAVARADPGPSGAARLTTGSESAPTEAATESPPQTPRVETASEAAMPGLAPNSEQHTLQRRATAITAGEYHTCALLDNRTVKCWGINSSGQLGDRTTTKRAEPVEVVGLRGSVAAVTAGGRSTCAVLDTGAGKCWGAIEDDGDLKVLTPVDIVGLQTDVASISAGGRCALVKTGAVKCWGRSSVIGPPPVEPVKVIENGAAAIASGWAGTSCALLKTGALKCWGQTDPVGPQSGIVSIAEGPGHTCVLLKNGTLKCWGYNRYGQLGDGTTSDRRSPVEVTGLGGRVSAVTVGTHSTCALLTTGAVRCWGANFQGQLGNGTATNSTVPVDVTGIGRDVISVAAGGQHACALLATGEVKCWGCVQGMGSKGSNEVRLRDPSQVNGFRPYQSTGVEPRCSVPVAIPLGEGQPQPTAVATCDENADPDLGPGSDVLLGRHSSYQGSDSWDQGMDKYVGTWARIIRRWRDESGCDVASVSIDGGEYEYPWRLRDANPDLNGFPTRHGLLVGRWRMARIRSGVVIWRADGYPLAKFVDESDGWWILSPHGRGAGYRVSSDGSKTDVSGMFDTRLPGQKRFVSPESSEYSSGSHRVRLVGDSIAVTLANDDQVLFKGDGTIRFKTSRGETVTAGE